MPNETGTQTSSFGAGRRESHDASEFYERSMYNGLASQEASPEELRRIQTNPPGAWTDQLYLHTAERMVEVPDYSVGLAFTSPPYNVGKDYDEDFSLEEYLDLIRAVGREVYRVLVPGGRYVVNVANLGRKPYIPLHALYYEIHAGLGFLPMGEVIWQKGKGASGSCAWGSWQAASAPRLRDIHEYLLVFSKQAYSRPDKGESDIDRDTFLKATLSVWEIPPESARRMGHPAPFPVALAERVIQLYSYVGDIVLAPFAGSGTTLVAANKNRRHFVGYEINPDYVTLAIERLTS